MTEGASTWRSLLAAYIAREAKPVEKYGHQPRLYELARLLEEGIPCDDDVVYAACWLHDLGVFEGHRPEDRELLARWDNVAYVLEHAPGLLADFGFPTEKTAAVLESIRTHQPHFEPQTIEAVILRDADILEQLGAVAILRTVCKVGRDTRFFTFTDAVTSLRTAVENLPGMLRLPRAKALAVARVAILRNFLEAAASESQGHLH